MSIPKIRIRKFNPSILEKKRLSGDPPTVVILGPRNTGKSTILKDLLSFIKDIPMLVCMSGTEEGNGFYSKFMHPLMIHNDYKKDIVSSIIRHQKDKLKKCIKLGQDPRKMPELGTGLILDDCGFDKKNLHSQDLRFLFMNGRHLKIAVFVCLQYVMGLPPDIRTNVDYLFCMRNNKISDQKKIYEQYFGCFKKFAHFQEVFNVCTEDYGCLVLDNTSKSSNLEDCIFYYKATPDRNYKIGSPDLWRYLDIRYKEECEEDDDDNGNGQVNIIVKKEPPPARE
jgi:Poxvirus A32 protein